MNTEGPAAGRLKPYLEAGEFVAVHGINGELRLYPWCDEPDFLSAFTTLYLDGQGQTAVSVEAIRTHKRLCVVSLRGVSSIEAARPFIGKTAYIARAAANLPSGRWFVQDLLGARVADAATGEVYGTLCAITHPGRHDVYEICRPNGDTVLFPAAPPFLGVIDADAGLITVRPITGMFEPLPSAFGDDE